MSSKPESDWITVLRETCAKRSQAKVAERIGYSATVVNQVLKGTYKGDLKAVQRAVEGALMGLTVDCPVVGEMPRNRCLEFQRQRFAATNPMRVQFALQCPTCPNRRGAE